MERSSSEWIESIIFLEKEKIINLYFFKQLNVILHTLQSFAILRSWFNSFNCVLILYYK